MSSTSLQLPFIWVRACCHNLQPGQGSHCRTPGGSLLQRHASYCCSHLSIGAVDRETGDTLLSIFIFKHFERSFWLFCVPIQVGHTRRQRQCYIRTGRTQDWWNSFKCCSSHNICIIYSMEGYWQQRHIYLGASCLGKYGASGRIYQLWTSLP